MEQDAYEKAYTEAREALYRRGKIVDKPRQGAGRIRYCAVDGVALTDSELFREAWGEALAQEILSEHNQSIAYETCPECDRLWQEYQL